MVSRRAGFTLVEALVALTITTLLITLVGTTFLVQNNFYANILQRSRVQDNARSVAEVVSGDLRSLVAGSLVTADSTRMVVRVPMTMVAVCRTSGSHAVVHLPGGIPAIDTDDVTGFAVRDGTTGAWTFYVEPWNDLYSPRSDDAERCAQNGADTTNATAEFMRFRMDDPPSVPPIGSALLLYRETEYVLQASALDPAATALYVGPSGGTLVELASGMDDDAHFKYKKATGGWAARFSSGLDAVNRIRVHAHARGPAETAVQADMEFDLEADVPLRNVP